MLESEIKKLTAALEANTAALLGRPNGAPPADDGEPEPAVRRETQPETPKDEAPAKADPPAKSDAKAEKPPSLEDVRAVASELMKAKKVDALRKILSSYGAESLTKVPEDARAACLAELKAALA